MKFLYSTALVALLSLFVLDVTPVDAQTNVKTKKLPFHGKLEAVDASAQTITIAGKTPRVFHLNGDTKITDGKGEVAALGTAVVGEDVGGSYWKDGETLMLFSVRLGAKEGEAEKPAKPAASTAKPAPAPTPAPAKPAPAPKVAKAPAAAPVPAAAAAEKAKKQKFSGKVVSVDAGAKTLVIHGKADQTFTVTGDTKITGASDLSGVAAGAKVTGTYTKGADGTLSLATLVVGK